ncbi:MAG TPA: biopolymer transporter Tol [Pirellulales bacterium]|jgi:Tol biopolymer transport system component|nr:biopolymer transporter Tol [Pirellulales bacterium]
MRPAAAWLASMVLLAVPTRGEEPSAASIESQHLSNLRVVTHGFVKAGEGYFSPDARTIVCQAITKDYPFYQIYTQPLDGGAPRLVSTGRGRTTCAAFAPDGKYLIYASSHTDPQLDKTEQAQRDQDAEDARSGRRRRYEWVFDANMDIYRADLDGSHLHNLTNSPGYDAEGSFSPDGKQIVFCSTRDGDPDLYVMNADGSNVRQLTNSPGYDGGPFISPDGRWVVFRSDRKQAEMLQIYVIGLDGSNETALTDNVGVNWAPYWHPTEPWIIWTGADHSDPNARPNYDLWLMKYGSEAGKIVPGPITRITDHPSADVLPVFSPDGRRLMWTSNRSADHSSQLWIADFVGVASR